MLDFWTWIFCWEPEFCFCPYSLFSLLEVNQANISLVILDTRSVNYLDMNMWIDEDGYIRKDLFKKDKKKIT